MFKVNNKNTRTTSMTSFWCSFLVFFVNFEHISHLFLMLLLLTLNNKQDEQDGGGGGGSDTRGQQARNQKFFRAGEVLRNQVISIKSFLKTQEKRSRRENFGDFLLDTLKTTFWMEYLTQKQTLSGLFFPKIRELFSIFKKGPGRFPPSPPSPFVARLNRWNSQLEQDADKWKIGGIFS